jgi:ribosome maturation protein Sdo1
LNGWAGTLKDGIKISLLIVEISKNLVVKYKKNGVSLEVLTISGTMKPYRDGKMKIENVLASEQIFSNAAKLEKAKASDITKCCGPLVSSGSNSSTEVKEKKGGNKSKTSKEGNLTEAEINFQALKFILDNGDFQLNTKEMKEMQDQKYGEILNYLHKYYHDPRGEKVTPHPVDRIDTVLKTLGLKIDIYIPLDQQIKTIVKKLQDQLPLKPMNPPHEMNLRY